MASLAPISLEDLPRMLRMSDYVSHYAKVSPLAEAAVCGEERLNYKALADRVDQLAKAFLAAGIGKGDRVATLATPSIDYLISFLAATSIGAIWIGLNPKYRAGELAYLVGDSGPMLLLTRTVVDERSYGAEIQAMREAGPMGMRAIALDSSDRSGLETWASFIAAGADVSTESFRTAREAVAEADPCLLVYTSGSTGKPKGAVLKHGALVAFAIGQNRHWPLSSVRMLNYFPINHVGCVCDITCPVLVAGGCCVFMEKFDPRAGLGMIAKERITLWGSVPSVFQLQLALPDFASFDLSSVELIVWEGAAMPRGTIAELRKICPRLATNYGMTETTSAITIVDPTDDLDVLAGSVGYPFDGVEVRLSDDAGNSVASGEIGEIQARSSLNMLGYWNRRQETEAAFTADGWFRTGDLAVERPDGRLQIVGRSKEMYKSGGYNVYPLEIEGVLQSHPDVADAAVVAVSDPIWQEVGVAFVVAEGSAQIDELERYCREHLANYKIPKRFIFTREMPLLPIGKINKPMLREWANMQAESGDIRQV
jgi:acyl-CoA synthetase (AMP-forming)/AMP-acid ligase II